jgi:hypothetical protein
MTTKREIEDLLTAYDRSIGMGNMKMAGRTFPQIIRALMTFVEERTPADTTEYDGKKYPFLEREIVAPEPKVDLNPPPCAPCDVSIPNNPDLIEEFKKDIVGSVEAPDGSGREIKYVVEAGLAEKAEAELGIDVEAEVKEALTEVAAEEVALEAAAVETPPVVEAEVAPAPKAPKKSKTDSES